ncbi:carboxypeptidase-like regulatory domain-containing protein [Maribacter litopenaei]|uniref:Carboxypeptidase-like regulatory domain-containing protein n=1 Tax=Maribacter litopenaei TaxID=2976127 RepID=A0ABY5Y640_9FLAO|nr:carboxypeptidase-like regulatory domain-containing protein [Maribacter litopenaei]UWX54144.1 carboxypeptidase-like regulatory domain-containing protein [Maribacter litopenaei]
MTKNLLALFLLFHISFSFSQDDGRRLILGHVLYKNVDVANEYVINSTSEEATVTDEDGEFAIRVKEGDELVFTAVNYQYQVLEITPEILEKNRIIVSVDEKVTELDEVVVTPENEERFLQLKNEEFKEVEYEIDRTTEVENIALSRTERGMQDGLNFVNIFKAIFKSKEGAPEEGPKLQVSEVLRRVYDDRFFVEDLQLPQSEIEAFLTYCDQNLPARSLLRKENEFQLIDSLVNLSKSFRETLNEE